MAKARLSRASLTGTVNYKARLSRATMTGSVGNVKARLSRASLTGTAPVSGKARISRATLTGTAVVIFKPFPDRTVSALSTQSITAILDPLSATPTSYVWRIIPGDGDQDTVIVGTGVTVTLVAPADWNGTFVEVGVKGVVGGTPGPETIIHINTLPHPDWDLRADDVWVATPVWTVL